MYTVQIQIKLPYLSDFNLATLRGVAVSLTRPRWFSCVKFDWGHLEIFSSDNVVLSRFC